MGNEIIFALIGLAAGAVIIYLFLPKKTGGADPGSLLMLQNQMNELIRSMDAKLGEGNNRMFESIRTQFGESQRLAADIRDLVAKQLSEVAKEQTKTNEATYRFMTIDAKFSLDNYNRLINAIDDAQREDLEKQFKNDLKKRIDETAKYVRVKDGTLPFA